MTILKHVFDGTSGDGLFMLNCCLNSGINPIIVNEGNTPLFKRRDSKCVIHLPRALEEDIVFSFTGANLISV